MKSRAIVLTVMLLFFTPIGVVTHRVGAGADFSTLSSVRLTNQISAGNSAFFPVEREIEAFMRRWHINGASVAIAREGRLVYARGFGYADTTRKVVVEPYHRFRVASVSKLITAVAVMKLVEEGLINLDDRVFGPGGIITDSYFDNPRDRRVYDISVGHLLAHRGGWSLRYGDHMFITPVISRRGPFNMPLEAKHYVRYALDRNLHFTPGSGSSYSNLGYVILGMVIEAVTGMTYDEYCRNEIFLPLGIYDSSLGFNLKEGRQPYEVVYYEQADAIPKLSIYGTGEMVPARYGGNDIESLGSAGGWIATAPDMLRFLLSVDGHGYKSQLLSDETIRMMTDRNDRYGILGWGFVSSNGNWWRTGSFPGTLAMMKRTPGDLSWVVLLNTNAWNGPELSTVINSTMTRALYRVRGWPENDLFSHSLPVPIPSDEPVPGYDGHQIMSGEGEPELLP